MTPKFYWRLSVWNGKKTKYVCIYMVLFNVVYSSYPHRMPTLYTSVLIVSTGVHSIYPSDAQMTRRVTRAVLNGRYNAGNYVSGCHNRTGIFFGF
jgi:hypothetical protein